MLVIPVIDLLNGAVVHAKKGDRKNYLPIQSSLTTSSKPLDVVAALLEYFPFQQLYIADLNAIQHLNDNNSEIIQAIAQDFPTLKLWVDTGISNKNVLGIQPKCDFNVILGSENFSEIENFINVRSHIDSDFILSLDFMPHGYQGPIELLNNTQHWPADVILMSLLHVGANQGTNLEILEKFKQHTAHFNLYAAGGIRDVDDLIKLKQAGIHGALVATALHQKQLIPAQIQALLN